MLATFRLLVGSAAFLGGSAPLHGTPARTALRHTAARDARRCPEPLLMASDSGGANSGKGEGEGPIEHWSMTDDAALAEYVAMRASAARCGRPDTVLSGVDEAWVLIFNLGKHDEGVYTLQGRASRAAAYVLAFERTDDADRFAQLLQAEGFDLATPLRWDSTQLSAFCTAGEFEVSLVPTGALITPPSKNEYDVDAFERMNDEAAAGVGADSDEPVVDAFASQRSMFEKLFNDGPTN